MAQERKENNAGNGQPITHKPFALSETFKLEKAKRIWDRFEFIYTPNYGSWLNMAEIELNVLMGQCLNRRIDSRPLKTQFLKKGQKIWVGRLADFENDFKNMRQKDKWFYFPLVDHSFEVHPACS